jgi:cell division transport system permease protein
MTDVNDLKINEPPSEISSGFLEDLWSSRVKLKTISGLELLWYFIQRGVQTVIALPVSNLITILTISISIFLLGGLLLGLKNIDSLISDAGNRLDITVYLKDLDSVESISNFKADLLKNPHVESVQYFTKNDALNLFKEALGSRSGFIEGLEEDNPLPASLEVKLKSAQIAETDIQNLITFAETNEIVSQVVYGSDWVNKVRAVLKIFRLFGVVVLAIVLSVVVFLITNTIKLVIYSRRDEIEIMQLVGASDGFVKIPFIVGGSLQGAIGSSLGLFLLWVGFYALNANLRASVILGVALPNLFFLSTWLCIVILVMGIFIGAVGSSLAIGKFMNV